MDGLTLEQRLDMLLELRALTLSKTEPAQGEEDLGVRVDEPKREPSAVDGASCMPDADGPLAIALDQQLANAIALDQQLAKMSR